MREEAFPAADNADELHDALMWCGFMTAAEIAEKTSWGGLAAELVAARRATLVRIPAAALWVAAERMPRFAVLFAGARFEPPIPVPEPYASETVTRENALIEIVRGRMEALGPVKIREVEEAQQMMIALLRQLETEGVVNLKGGGDEQYIV